MTERKFIPRPVADSRGRSFCMLPYICETAKQLREETALAYLAWLAQQVERRSEEPEATGSIPAPSTRVSPLWESPNRCPSFCKDEATTNAPWSNRLMTRSPQGRDVGSSPAGVSNKAIQQNRKFGSVSRMVSQRTVNPSPNGIAGSSPVRPICRGRSIGGAPVLKTGNPSGYVGSNPARGVIRVKDAFV